MPQPLDALLPPTNPGRWPVVELAETHAPEVRELFARVFGHALSPALWHWKYGQGRGLATGMRDSTGALVAHYGGTLRPMVHQGQCITTAQVGDVMVAAEVRDVWARFGPFGRVAKHFIDTHLGPGRALAFGFGFPNARAMRLGQRLGLYSAIDEVRALTWQPGAQLSLPAGWSLEPIDWASPATVPLLNELGQQLHQQHPQLLCPVRNGDWWRHRFANHPDHAYACFWLFHQSVPQPCGALVLRHGGVGQRSELLDWVGNADAAQGVVPAGMTQVLARGGSDLHLWATPAVVASLPQQVVAQAGTELACQLAVTHAQVLGHSAASWAGGTWFTGGDTDFR